MLRNFVRIAISRPDLAGAVLQTSSASGGTRGPSTPVQNAVRNMTEKVADGYRELHDFVATTGMRKLPALESARSTHPSNKPWSIGSMSNEDCSIDSPSISKVGRHVVCACGRIAASRGLRNDPRFAVPLRHQGAMRMRLLTSLEGSARGHLAAPFLSRLESRIPQRADRGQRASTCGAAVPILGVEVP